MQTKPIKLTYSSFSFNKVFRIRLDLNNGIKCYVSKIALYDQIINAFVDDNNLYYIGEDGIRRPLFPSTKLWNFVTIHWVCTTYLIL